MSADLLGSRLRRPRESWLGFSELHSLWDLLVAEAGRAAAGGASERSVARMGHCRTRQGLDGGDHEILFLVTGTASPGEARRLRRLYAPMLGGEGDAGTNKGGALPDRGDSVNCENAHLRVKHWTNDTREVM